MDSVNALIALGDVEDLVPGSQRNPMEKAGTKKGLPSWFRP
jgi:hypothetical protein